MKDILNRVAFGIGIGLILAMLMLPMLLIVSESFQHGTPYP